MAAVHELQVVYDSPYDNPDQGRMKRRLFDVVADGYHSKGGNAGSSTLPDFLPLTSSTSIEVAI